MLESTPRTSRSPTATSGAGGAGAQGERGRSDSYGRRGPTGRSCGLGGVDVPPRRAGQGHRGVASPTPPSPTPCVADVAVDDETREVVVERLVQVYDVGRAINPTLVERPDPGRRHHGLGLALLEESFPYYPSTEHGPRVWGPMPPRPWSTARAEKMSPWRTPTVGPFGARPSARWPHGQSPAIVAAIHDARPVSGVPELAGQARRVAAALDERRQPAGRPRVIFDETL